MVLTLISTTVLQWHSHLSNALEHNLLSCLNGAHAAAAAELTQGLATPLPLPE
jgi:hypothetical protein